MEWVAAWPQASRRGCARAVSRPPGEGGEGSTVPQKSTEDGFLALRREERQRTRTGRTQYDKDAGQTWIGRGQRRLSQWPAVRRAAAPPMTPPRTVPPVLSASGCPGLGADTGVAKVGGRGKMAPRQHRAVRPLEEELSETPADTPNHKFMGARRTCGHCLREFRPAVAAETARPATQRRPRVV
eukprot:gene18072-biopygen11437